jgi:hypothetical protein
MPKKRFSVEQIVTLLRQIEVSMAQDVLAHTILGGLHNRYDESSFRKRQG